MVRKNKIPIFDVKFSRKERDLFYQYCETIFDEAYLANHTFVQKFEKEFAKFCSSQNSIMVSSGTSALEISLLAIGIEGKEVIIPVNTFIATFVAVKNAGGIPIICDIESEYFSIDPDDMEKKISKKTAAIIVVHTAGIVSPNIERIQSICNKENISLVEDAAHAHGSEYKGMKAGSFGRFGCFSHFLTKNMTTGEGGSVVCSSSDHDSLASIRQFGKTANNSLIHDRTGSNYKVTEFQAALGLIELTRIEERLNARRSLVDIYARELEGSIFKVFVDKADMKTSFYKCVITSPLKHDDIKEVFSRAEIPLTGSVYRYPLNRQPICKNYLNGDYPVSDWFADHHFCPPCFPEITKENVLEICKLLKSI